MMLNTLLIIVFFFFASLDSLSIRQNPNPRPSSNKSSANSEQGKIDDPEQGALPEEVRLRMKREREESDYRKTVETAAQLLDTSVDIAKSYKETSVLNDESFKKISAMEKLARKILAHLGGDVVEPKDEKETVSVPDAIDQMIIAAENIKKHLTTDTRYVVSTEMITESNQIIHLAQHLRRGSKHGN